MDAIAFADEEAHYGSFIGSRSLAGLLDGAEIDRLTNRYDGKSPRRALEEAGLAGRPRLSVQESATRGSSKCTLNRARRSRARTTASGWSRASSGSSSVHRLRGTAGPCWRDHDGGAARWRPCRGAGAGLDRFGVPEALTVFRRLDQGGSNRSTERAEERTMQAILELT